MADEYQIQYEYVAASTIDFKTNDLEITYTRPKMFVDVRVDGTIVVSDRSNSQRIFTFSAIISGTDHSTLKGVQTAAIDYTGLYPRIQKIYYAGAVTESNIEVAMTSFTALDLGPTGWLVNITLTEKDQ